MQVKLRSGMVRSPGKEKEKEKRGNKKKGWTVEEDRKLIHYIDKYGIWNWTQMPRFAGLSRSGKSCRLRWMNYLNPDVKRGNFTEKEEEIIITMYQKFGSRWSLIAKKLEGRTDNEIKNYWHTRLKKKFLSNNKLYLLMPSSTSLVHDANKEDESPDHESIPRKTTPHEQEITVSSLPFAGQVSSILLESHYNYNKLQMTDDTSSSTTSSKSSSSSTTTTLVAGCSDIYGGSDDDDETINIIRSSTQLESVFAELKIGDHNHDRGAEDLMLENYDLSVIMDQEQQMGFLLQNYSDQLTDDHDLPSSSLSSSALLSDPLNPLSCFYNDVYCDILFNFPDKRRGTTTTTTHFEEDLNNYINYLW